MDKNFIELELRIFAKEQTVLIMSSDDNDISVLNNTLSSFFKQVVIAKNYEDAKNEYIKQHFDIVIISTDFENKYGGIKACRQIRDRNEHQVIVLIGSTNAQLDTDMFIELLEMNIATFIPHLFSIEFVMMKIMQLSEKIVYKKVDIYAQIEQKTKQKEETKEKIKTKKENKEHSIDYKANHHTIHTKVSAISFVERLAKKDNFKLLKYTIDNLNDLHYDFEKLIFELVSCGNGQITQNMKNELVDILFSYEDNLVQLEEFNRLSQTFGLLGYYVDDILVENFNNKAFDVMWYLNDDLKKLVNHIFIKKDIDNIHFLDESIISSLEQLRNNIDKTKISSNDKDDIEIF